jgi:hypothetical protein
VARRPFRSLAVAPWGRQGSLALLVGGSRSAGRNTVQRSAWMIVISSAGG